MRYEINGVRNWASLLDEGTRLQAEKAARCPAVSGPVALMPDAHVGIGATVGSVIPTKNAIIPSAVGVDIGCGMIAARLNLTANDLPDSLTTLHSAISKNVPAGVGKGHQEQKYSWSACKWLVDHPNNAVQDKLFARAQSQLGSLGSGNHFAEVCLDESDNVWIVLHSGSRGVGNQLGTKHIKLARTLELGLEDKDLHYFTEGTKEFKEYIKDMLWAQEYAMLNRELMFVEILNQVRDHVRADAAALETINCHHNFASQELHGGETIWVTRKGAIKADIGDMGVIPGSMGAGSYIVKGRGNPLSYTSCSHGAGRTMSRSQAKKELSLESLTTSMKGRTWNSGSAEALLDEHPDAYKNIDQVMEDQRDLVDVVHTLHQVLNYKGV